MNEPDKRKYRSERAEVGARAAVAVAWIAGLMALVIGAMIIVNHVQVTAAAPLGDEPLAALKKQLQENPQDQDLRERIRTLDLLARRAFFTSREQVKTGGILLLVAVAVFLLSSKTALELRRRHPQPDRCPGAGETMAGRAGARWGAAAGGGAIVATALVLALLSPPAALLPDGGAELPPPPKGGEDPAAFCVPDPVPDHAWPCFRGPLGTGIAVHSGAPLSWNGETGENIRWKVPVPKLGFSSPVVWENRVFLTGSDDKTQEVYCFDADTGNLLWRQEMKGIPGSPKPLPEVMESTGYAAATAATDGKRVFALFATGDLAAFTLDGTKSWARNLGVPKNTYGHSSSPIVFPSRLLIQYDGQEGGHLLALEPQTGKTIWDQRRDVRESWATPVVVNTGSRLEVLLNAKPNVISHDPVTGKILWSLKCIGMDAEVAPSPAYAAGIAFAGSDHTVMAAIRIGDPPELLWKVDEDLPDVSSPVATEKYFIMASSGGVVTCLESTTGKPVWRKEFRHGFYASPVMVGDRIYLTDMEGVTFVFRIGESYEELARNVLGEKASCTAAYPKGRIYLRGLKHLYCIGKDE